MMTSLRRYLRQPLVHFVFAGSVLFAAERRLATPATRDLRDPIVISQARVAGLEADYVAQWGRSPTAPELAGEIELAIDDEMLYREARLLRLDAGDASIRARLVQKMRAVSDDPSLSDEALYQAAVALRFDDDVVVRRMLQAKMSLLLQREPADAPPSDDELVAYLESHRARFVRPPLLSFRHVFLAPAESSDQPKRDAAEVLRTLQSRTLSDQQIASLSDAFALGLEFRAVGRGDLARHFGEAFADAVAKLPVGTWSGPIASPFGAHLVRVDERSPERMPPIDAVRQQIARAVLEARAVRHRRDGLRRLRALYTVRVEAPPGVALPAGGRAP